MAEKTIDFKPLRACGELAGWPAGSEQLEQGQELPPALALTDPVVHLTGGKVQGGEHGLDLDRKEAELRREIAIANQRGVWIGS